MVVLDGNFALGFGPGTYISMYARTNKCYKERGSRTNYVRYSIPHCIFPGETTAKTVLLQAWTRP